MPLLARAPSAYGTVLIAGGLTQAGRELACHLVSEHHLRHLVLTTLGDRETPEAASAVEAVTALGALTVRVVACDGTDRGALARALATIPPEQPLAANLDLRLFVLYSCRSAVDCGAEPAPLARRSLESLGCSSPQDGTPGPVRVLGPAR